MTKKLSKITEGERLRSTRKELKLTRVELCDFINRKFPEFGSITQSTIFKWETEKNTVSQGKLQERRAELIDFLNSYKADDKPTLKIAYPDSPESLLIKILHMSTNKKLGAIAKEVSELLHKNLIGDCEFTFHQDAIGKASCNRLINDSIVEGDKVNIAIFADDLGKTAQNSGADKLFQISRIPVRALSIKQGYCSNYLDLFSAKKKLSVPKDTVFKKQIERFIEFNLLKSQQGDFEIVNFLTHRQAADGLESGEYDICFSTPSQIRKIEQNLKERKIDTDELDQFSFGAIDFSVFCNKMSLYKDDPKQASIINGIRIFMESISVISDFLNYKIMTDSRFISKLLKELDFDYVDEKFYSRYFGEQRMKRVNTKMILDFWSKATHNL